MPGKQKTLSGNRIHFIRDYVWNRQPPAIRWLHIAILCLVLNQILVSNFMWFGSHEDMIRHPIDYFGIWIHISGGLLLIPLMAVFIYLELRRHGFTYFFGCFYGHFSQIKEDVRQLARFKLPEPRAQGLAAVVQGLGMGAMILVLAAGLFWFLAWISGDPRAGAVKEIHEELTGLVELYVIGHGAMGVIHLAFQHPDTHIVES